MQVGDFWLSRQDRISVVLLVAEIATTNMHGCRLLELLVTLIEEDWIRDRSTPTCFDRRKLLTLDLISELGHGGNCWHVGGRAHTRTTFVLDFQVVKPATLVQGIGVRGS